jgi:hypothetical protein
VRTLREDLRRVSRSSRTCSRAHPIDERAIETCRAALHTPNDASHARRDAVAASRDAVRASRDATRGDDDAHREAPKLMPTSTESSAVRAGGARALHERGHVLDGRQPGLSSLLTLVREFRSCMNVCPLKIFGRNKPPSRLTPLALLGPIAPTLPTLRKETTGAYSVLASQGETKKRFTTTRPAAWVGDARDGRAEPSSQSEASLVRPADLVAGRRRACWRRDRRD